MLSVKSAESLDPPANNKIEHAEYTGSLRSRPHIPPVEFIYENDLPIRLHTKYGDYEVAASREQTSVDVFFQHELERYDNGAIKSLSFSNPYAYEYVRYMLRTYKSSSISQIVSSMDTEMQLEHYQKPGSYENELREYIDKIKISATRKMLKFGEDRNNNNLFGDIENIVDFLLVDEVEGAVDVVNELLGIRFDEDKNTIYFNEHDLFDDLNLEVINWVEGIQVADIPITMQRIKLETKRGDLVVRRIILGDKKLEGEDAFLVEERVLETGMFSATLFGHNLRKNITIFDNLHFDYNKLYEFFPGDKPLDFIYSPRSSKFNGAPASKIGNLVFLDTGGKLISDSDTHIEVKRSRVSEATIHESAHMFDIYDTSATAPQADGYARSVEYGFSFPRSVYELRHVSEYKNEITMGKLGSILSISPPEGLVSAERYDVPAAFFCYIYEKLGREKFAQFYGLLTGGVFDREKTEKEDLITSIVGDSQENYYRGNMLACLHKVMSADEKYAMSSPKEFVDNFLQVVNNKEIL